MIDRYSLPEMRAVWSQDSKLRRWLEVEIAVVEAWARAGVVPEADARIVKEKASATVEAVANREEITRHDVAAFVDVVAEACGEAGRWVHFGLTSSDVLDTALATQVRDAATLIRASAADWFQALKSQAFRYRDTPCVGRTHGMHAEPTTFGAKMASFAAEVARFVDRLDRAVESAVVGKVAGAVGTYSTVGPEIEEFVCSKLGVGRETVPTQVVGRDRIAEFLCALGLGAAAVERFATEIRHLQRSEVAEVEEPFGESQKGSSAMPHKRNPVASERLCGLARVVRALIVPAMEDVALWHERDISHSSVERTILPDACALVHFMLHEARRITEGLRVDSARMRENLELTKGVIFSQNVLLALINAGWSRDEAYRLVQSAAQESSKTGRPLAEVLAEREELRAAIDREQLETCFVLERTLERLGVVFDRLEGMAIPPPPALLARSEMAGS